MTTINGRACVANGKPVDKVFSNGRQVYGRNLLLDTNNTITTLTNLTGWGGGKTWLPSLGTLDANQTYTFSCYLEPAKHDVAICMHIAPSVQHYNGNIFGTTVTAGSKGISTLTMALTLEDLKVFSYWVSFTNEQTDTSTVSFSSFKLEKGSVATPWTPAPEDVM